MTGKKYRANSPISSNTQACLFTYIYIYHYLVLPYLSLFIYCFLFFYTYHLQPACAILRQENLGSDYHIHVVKTTPEDMGFFSVTRERQYLMLVHKKRGRFLRDPVEVFNRISSKLRMNRDVVVGSLFWETNASALRDEVLSSLTPARLSEDSLLNEGATDWTPFLNAWEANNVQKYTELWLQQHPNLDEAVFVLNQNPDKRKSMSSKTGEDPARMPTLWLCFIMVSTVFLVTLCFHMVSKFGKQVIVLIYLVHSTFCLCPHMCLSVASHCILGI